MLTSNRVQLLSLTPVFLTHLSLSCGGKGQEIREMAAEKLEGVAEKLADAGTATQIPTPPQTPEKIPADVSSITSLPTVPAATTHASVASTTPIPSPAPSVKVTPTPPTIPTTNAPISVATFTQPSASAIPASITVEQQSAEPGQVVTVTGSGFPPITSMASLTLGGVSVLQPFPIATDASGEFTTDALILSLPNGVHEVVFTVGITSTATTFTVTGSP